MEWPNPNLFPRIERTKEKIKHILTGLGVLATHHILYEGKSDHRRSPGEQIKATHQKEWATEQTQINQVFGQDWVAHDGWDSEGNYIGE